MSPYLVGFLIAAVIIVIIELTHPETAIIIRHKRKKGF